MKYLYSKTVGRLLSGVYGLIFFYGFVCFPGAPIKPCDAGFCGKHGVLYSEEAYRQFVIWERTLMVGLFLLCVYSLIGWALKKK